MKKLLAVLLALVMLVSLAACAGNTDKDNPSSDAPANSDNPSMKANVNKKIAMIMQQGGLGDQGFNDTAYAGLMTCKEKYDLDVNAVECTDTTQGETLIRELCEAGYGLIINLEAGISGNMYTVARDYPDIYFVVVGRQLRINAVDGFTETPKNVIEWEGNHNEAMRIVKTGSGRQKKILLLRVCSILSFLSFLSRGYKGKPSMTGVVPDRGRLLISI